MLGSHRISILVDHKDKLYESSVKFAKFDSPDFIIMREAVLAFEKLVIHQIGKSGVASDADKKHLF